MTLDELNGRQRRLLAAVGCYRLLNPQQMMRLGVAGSEATIRAEAAVLVRKGLIGRSNPHLVVGVTALPCLYWLKDRGADLLAIGSDDDPEGARRKLGDAAHIMHRIATVNVHIALRQWAASAGVTVQWFVTDFEPGSGGRGKPTTIIYNGQHGPRFTPDALASVVSPEDGRSRLLVLEVERGRRDAKRPSDFKAKHDQLREVSAGRIVEGWDRWHGQVKDRARFLVVFATAELRNKALAAWPEPDAEPWRNFFVKCDDELIDFNVGWWRPGGRSRRPLFSWATSAQPTTTRPPPVA